jgi:hypothetical protein
MHNGADGSVYILTAAKWCRWFSLHINSGKMVQMVVYILTAAKWCRWFRITD